MSVATKNGLLKASYSELANAPNTRVLLRALAVSTSSGSVTLDGDVTGASDANTVVKLRGRALSGAAPVDGQVLAWNSGSNRWQPTAASTSVTMVGDVTGPSGANTVTKVNGATVPAAGALTTGNVLKVSSVGALTYGAVNLAGGANHVTGTLPAANQAAQTLTGDVTGTAGSSTVAKLQGRALASAAPTNGQAIAWNSVANQWEPTTVSGAASSLAATLAVGRTTGADGYTTGTDIVLSSGNKLTTAAGANPGNAGVALTIEAGAGNTSGTGGNLNIRAGQGSSGAGGYTYIRGGSSSSSYGGTVWVTGGATFAFTGSGGSALLLGGEAVSGGAQGGDGVVAGGSSPSLGGEARLSGGPGNLLGVGGPVRITGGAGGSTSGDSGSVTVKPGAVVSGTAGSVFLQNSAGANRLQIDSTGIGFFNATPVAQPSDINALTAATGTATTTINDVTGVFDQTILNNNFKSLAEQINNLRTQQRNLGLMA